jgi:hypothetical protein
LYVWLYRYWKNYLISYRFSLYINNFYRISRQYSISLPINSNLRRLERYRKPVPFSLLNKPSMPINWILNNSVCFQPSTWTFKTLTLDSGWPDWANFRALGDCFLWAVFWKLQKKHRYLYCLCPRKKLRIKCDEKWVGLTFLAIFSPKNLAKIFKKKYFRHKI